jgi:ketose-bisphosphate aldolase
MSSLLRNALDGGYAVGYFEAWNLESLLAVKDAAVQAESPVIIGFNGKFLGNRRRRVKENINHYGSLGRSVAEQARVPMAFILNEADEPALLHAALEAGFNVIMHDHEGCSLQQSIDINISLVRAAHAVGAEVEAELGELPAWEIGEKKMSAGVTTDPGEAQRFVEKTGVDALAVAVGNVHILEGRKSRLDLDLLGQLRKRIRIPLVLHGGTGIDQDDLKAAISAGICKVNVGTALRRAFINSLEGWFQKHDADLLDPGEVTSTGGELDMMAAARADVAAEVVRLMTIFGSVKKAGV